MNGIIRQMENPRSHALLVKNKEKQEAREGDAKYWADKFTLSINRLKELLEKGEIHKDDGGIGQSACKFVDFLHNRNCTIRSRKKEELFSEYLKESDSPYGDFEIINFLAKTFEKKMTQ